MFKNCLRYLIEVHTYTFKVQNICTSDCAHGHPRTFLGLWGLDLVSGDDLNVGNEPAVLVHDDVELFGWKQVHISLSS